MVRPLFILGPSRSGTTALTDYLNQHEEIMICMERYKYVPEQVTPEALTFGKILDYVPRQGTGETNTPRERHIELLAGKDPQKLKWIGDKGPGNAKRYKAISENNPGAHFLITYRPIEEVVESFEKRAEYPDDPWIGGKDGLKMGVHAWNRAMSGARQYLETSPEPNGLIISYHDFFSRSSDYIPLLSRFLEIDFDGSIAEAWENTSREFESSRRRKKPVTEEKAAYIAENKDHAAEEWMLERIERQWHEPGLYKQSGGAQSDRRKLAAALMKERARTQPGGDTDQNLERAAKRLENRLTRERRQTKALRRENRTLENKINNIQASRSWKLLSRLRRLRSAVSGTRLHGIWNSGMRKRKSP